MKPFLDEMHIDEVRTALQAPKMNAFAERLIGRGRVRTHLIDMSINMIDTGVNLEVPMRHWAVLSSLVVVIAGCAPPPGPAPLWSQDPQGDNPMPDLRRQNDSGGIVTSPDALRRFLPKGIDTAATDTLLLGWTEQLAGATGWGRFAPVLVRFETPLAGEVDAAALSFVSLDADAAPIPVRAAWHANPGVLEVQPLAPLPADARVALVVTRALIAGTRLERSADFDAHCQLDGKADLEAAAKRAGVGPDDVALLVSYRTERPTDDLLRARDLIEDTVPRFRFDAGERHGVFAPADAPTTITQHPDELATRLAGAGLVAVGFFTSADVRDPDTSLFDERILSGAAPPRDNEIEVILVEPDPALFPPPWPAVIMQHGFGGTDAFVVDNAASFVKRGMAVLGIDAVSHGQRGSVAAFLRLDDTRIVRDNLRQTVVDQLMLQNLAALAPIDVDGVPGNDLDGTVAYYGHSMGAVLGSTFAMVSRRADVVAVNAPGGGLCDVFRSESLKASLQLLFRPMLGIGIDDPVYDDAFPLLTAMVQPLLEGADPIAYARLDQRPHVLLQMDIGDRLVPNVSTEDLARAMGVPATTGAAENSAGLDALVSLDIADFDYPQDKNPHGLFEVQPIQEQAAAFVASRGRTLIDALP